MERECLFVSHGTAVELNRAIFRGEISALSDPDITILPEPSLCIRGQRQFRELAQQTPDLWNSRRPGPIHAIVPFASARSNGEAVRFHVWGAPVPDKAFVRVHERVLVSSPLFTVLQLALATRPSRLVKERAHKSAMEEERMRRELGLSPSRVSMADLLAWEHVKRTVESACIFTEIAGTYCLPAREGESVIYGVSPRVVRAQMDEFLNGWPALKGIMRARCVAACAFDGSASPMETALALMLTLPVAWGGYGLPRPELNARVAVHGDARALSSKADMFIDLLWKREGVAVEYDSREFHGLQGSAKLVMDTERANSLTALGYHALSVTYLQVTQQSRLDLLARQIAGLLGVRLVEPDETQLVWRTRLHALLMPVANS